MVRVANGTIHTQCTGCSHLLFFGKQLAVLGVVVDLFVVPLPFCLSTYLLVYTCDQCL